MLRLFGDALWESPYVYSAFVTLREKGLEFETVELDLDRGDHRKAPFAVASLTAKVPALEHGDFWLTESLAIVEYLDERFPPPQHAPMLPRAVEERARARQVLGYLRSGIEKLRGERPTRSLFFEKATAPLGDAARADADRLIRLVERLLPPGADQLFSTWSIADAELALALHRLIINGDPVPDAVRTYAESTWARPSVRAYVEHPRPHEG
jgi:glutathione S-transferase